MLKATMIGLIILAVAAVVVIISLFIAGIYYVSKLYSDFFN